MSRDACILRRRDLLRRACVAWLASALLLAVCGCARPAERPRRVVLIVVDTLRVDHLSCYGYPRATSPAIDRLAADGLRFEHAVSQAPWTTPSIGAILTSRYPTALGIKSRRAALPDEARTLAEELRAGGFATGAVVSHSFCTARWKFDQGFDWFDESNVLGHAGVSSPGVTARALEFLEAHREEPFFLWLHYFDPHFAYHDHAEFPFPGPEGYDGPVSSGIMVEDLARLDLTAADLDQVTALYDSEIAYTDLHVGRVLERMRELGMYDDALIVFLADHGEEFLDHGHVGHTKTLYQELVHVPLIVKVPGTAPGVVTETVASVDVAPTVLAAVGLEPPPGMVGRSLLGPLAPRPVFSETARYARQRAVVHGRMKLIEDLDRRSFALYDLAADPEERHDLAQALPEVAADLRGILRDWQREASYVRFRARVELTAEEDRHLSALGYAGGEGD